MSKKCKTAAIHWEIHSKKGSTVLAWRLKMKAMPETRGLYGRMTSTKDVLLFCCLLGNQKILLERFSKKAAVKQEQVVKN